MLIEISEHSSVTLYILAWNSIQIYKQLFGIRLTVIYNCKDNVNLIDSYGTTVIIQHNWLLQCRLCG